jgi:O-antigen ligase
MHAAELSLRVIKNWQWCVVLLLLLLAPVNSKLAGACWLALCLLGFWSFKYGSVKAPTAEFSAARGWVFACLLALALRVIPQFYWGDSWGERHAEFRLLFGALGLLGLVHYARFTSLQLKWLGYALVLALWAGFGWMLVFGAALAPTNQIPWGASMSLLVCVVLALTLSASSQPLSMRLFYASGVVVGVCAVLLSQARGSYCTVLWVGGVVLWHYATSGIKWRALMSRFLVGLVAVTLLVQIFPQLISIPVQRIQLAVHEFSAMDRTKEASLNTSVGVRLYLWTRAVKEVPDHLFLGVGREARMASIQRWGVEVNSTAAQSLGHLHNNYVEELFDQGLFGLGSFMSFLAGLFYMVMRLRKEQPMAALGMAGILFMHSSSSLTNVNFAHNYYPTMLSVAVAVCLLLFMKPFVSDDVTLRN